MRPAPGADRWRPWYGLVALLIGLIVGAVAEAFAEGNAHATTLSPTAVDVGTVIQDLGFVGAAVWLAALVAPVRPAQFGLLAPRSLWRAVAVAVAAIILVILFEAVYFAALNSTGEEKEFVKEIGGNAGTASVLAVCALTTVIAPICEEVLFRGLMFRSLANRTGVWPAAVITGMVFGVVHGLSAPAIDLGPLAFLGFALCAVYYLGGSLYPCIALHAINNAIALSGDENWNGGRLVALLVGSLVLVALVLAAVRLASARWTPATD